MTSASRPDVQYQLSPNGTKFGILTVSNDSNRAIPRTINQSRVSFEPLTDDDLRKVFKELRQKLLDSDVLKRLFDQYFVDKSILQNELTAHLIESQKKSTEESQKEKLSNELNNLAKELNKICKSTVGVSFDNTCPICIDCDCDHRFTCCKNGICSNCKDLFVKEVKCPFCRATIIPSSGIELGPSRQQEQFNKTNTEGSRTIRDAVNLVLNPTEMTEESLLKSQIMREALNASKAKTRKECQEEIDKDKNERTLFAVGKRFVSFVLNPYSSWDCPSSYNILLEKEAERPLIYEDILEATITKWLYETRDSYKLLILDGNHLTRIDLLVSLQSSSLYLHHEDNRKSETSTSESSNSVLEIIPKTLKKFALRQSNAHLPTVVNDHEFTIISPSNHETISRVLKDSINKLITDGFISNPFACKVSSTYYSSSSTSKLNVRDFILRWIQSIPIQVARIDAGVFLPLQDGHDSSQWLQMEQVNGVTAQQIAKKLRFEEFLSCCFPPIHIFPSLLLFVLGVNHLEKAASLITYLIIFLM
ncbi:hypothetical protein GEMRC1_009096 [Eukaryota sp. GEM-RC1]